MKILKSYQSEINTALEIFLQNYSLENPSEPEKKLLEAIRYGTVLGGKRIRPILGLMSFEVCKNQNTKIPRDQVIKSLISVELIHAYSLIHDDLPAMDNDVLRRGQTTVWKQFGEVVGILAGDVLQSMAFENITKEAPDYAVRELIQILASCSGLNGMGGGQMRDLYYETHDLTLEKLIETHRKKTGRLIYASALMGAILAESDTEKKQRIGDYAEKIGLAFQVKDDLLDREGDEKLVGKKVGKDVNKKGFIKFLGVEKTRHFLDQLIVEALDLAQKLESENLEALAGFIQKRTI